MLGKDGSSTNQLPVRMTKALRVRAERNAAVGGKALDTFVSDLEFQDSTDMIGA